MIEAKVIADSISNTGVRLTTLQLKYPRFIHSEFMTHRVFSRNASSSRAIPVAKMLEMIKDEPAMPVHWGKNIAGMQADGEVTNIAGMEGLWKEAARQACSIAKVMTDSGLHKQVANRILEPFQHIHVVITATEWSNFFMLRDHKDAQPEIQVLARSMNIAMDMSHPKLLMAGEWHLPYVTQDEVNEQIYTSRFSNVQKMSAARCARVSYMKHDGQKPSLEDDIKLYERLVISNPPHMSPIEHQATPAIDADIWSGNFKGWIQYRKLFEQGLV